jgi:hypothetical protein
MVRRIKSGDVFEIHTQKGLAYAQFLFKDKMYGNLIKVFKGFFAKRPEYVQDLMELPVQLKTFIPLQAAINQGIFEVIGRQPVSDEDAQLPLFKMGIRDPHSGKVAVWFLWDGKREWRIDELTSEQRSYPWRGTLNDTLLIERIEEGWTQEDGVD